MNRKLKLGVFLHDRYLTDGRITVSKSQSLDFVRHLGLGESINLSVVVLPTENIVLADYHIIAEQMGINVIPLPPWKDLPQTILSLPFTWRLLLRKAQELVRSSDIIWLRTPSAISVFFWWQARKSHKPVIIHITGNILLAARPPKYKGFRSFVVKVASYCLHFLMRWMNRYGIVFVTGGELQKLFSTPLHPAYQLDDILISQKDLRPIRKRKGIARRLLFVGRFDHGKGINVLLDTFESLLNEVPDLILTMAGDGVLLEPTRKDIIERGLGRNVKLLGFVSANGSLQKLYRESDIFVLPSDSYPEGFPRVILEAWTKGLPVVATRLAGIPYRVRDNKNGLLVEPGSRSELREALLNLIKDGDLRYSLAEGGLRTVGDLTFETQSRHVRELIDECYPDFQLHSNLQNN